MKNVIRLWFLACLLSACAGHEHEKTTHPVPTAMERSTAVAPSCGSILSLVTPESVLHDPEQDVYFISNVFGGLEAVDGNGNRLKDGEGEAATDVPRGQLDGLVFLPDGSAS